jgi:hypothetical protein
LRVRQAQLGGGKGAHVSQVLLDHRVWLYAAQIAQEGDDLLR